MKKMFLTVAIGFLSSITFAQQKEVYVSGYVKSNGTVVQPHVRTAPDKSFQNNWTTVGNVNPYNGNVGTKTTPSNTSYNYNSTISYPAYNTSPKKSKTKSIYNF